VTHRETFDLASTPLHDGVTLIEASAGTGKTFAIAGLFLRLLLERDYSVREMLVVTFTEAATAELRGRIRERLAQAASALQTGATTDDVLRAILQPHLSRREAMLGRLERALSGFDEAPIFTIHGFCQRTLRDRAFESGALFDTELLEDDSPLLQQIAEDFWRLHFYETETLPVEFLLKNEYQPENFPGLLRIRTRHPALRVISTASQKSVDEVFAELKTAFTEAGRIWREREEEIRAAFGDVSIWAKGEHAKKDVRHEKWLALAACFDNATHTVDSLDALAFFASSSLAAGTRCSATTPKHRFFDLCDRIIRCEKDLLTALHVEFLQFAEIELPRRKQQRKVVSFEDLLTRLHGALHAPGGDALAAEVRSRYKAALIDEFQDTDPVQYEIFGRIFASNVNAESVEDLKRSGAARHSIDHAAASVRLLFLIGDPKQAIYGFRGADIFTYLDAAAAVDRAYTLSTNFRSESALVRAVNTMFGAVQKPFLFEEIQFQPVKASGHADAKPLLENGAQLPPLHLWFMERQAGKTPIAKEYAECVVPGVVASEIARLLNRDTRIGDARLSPKDIAVLVPENRQARLMQDALRVLNIPSVLYTEESVFASLEAHELARVLAAIAQPSNERLLRPALATDLLGLNAQQIEALGQDETAWQAWVERFRSLHDAWRERGFTAMFRQWLHTENIRQRLLGLVDGERRVTNLLHLGELLHQACLEHTLSLAGLRRWLSGKIASEDKAAEEHQLRLERDDDAVKLVTIHKSKGLEYPIVFCPFSWKSSKSQRREKFEPVFFHERPDSNAGSRATEFICDLGSENFSMHRELEAEERLAENLRLLYVATTRARNRCYIVCGAFRGADTSALAWLLHRPLPSRAGEGLADISEHFKSLDDETLKCDLERLVERSVDEHAHPALLLKPLPEAAGDLYQPAQSPSKSSAPRHFTRCIPRDWRILSFSGLTANRRAETPDYDASEDDVSPPESAIEAENRFAFPRGTTPGTCIHKILEALDFTKRDDTVLRALVRDKLAEHGLATNGFADAICGMIRNALAVPLAPGRADFVLADVTLEQRLNELEFLFPIRRLTPALLRSCFAGCAESTSEFLSQLGRLGFQPAGGFIIGFIDLVFQFEERFYIVDWKSNWLGNRIEDYGPEALTRAMAERLYPLQYHLYTLAVHRYLKLRLPGYDYDKHYGGVRYLFLRGLDPARPAFGVFSDRPDRALIERLDAELLENPQP
jgi:exodeoxyribonuclease V beta subunit